jgi:putative transposase
MPRCARLKLADMPFHVIKRGNNRCPCFVTDTDRHVYLEQLRCASVDHGAVVHAYVLMTNHVHLLMTGAEAESIGQAMRQLGQAYAQYFNRRYGRSGTLWEGRHKGSLVDTEGYLFICHRYIECNPVRAGMVAAPVDYPWSSHRANAVGAQDPLLTPHGLVTALSGDPDQRRHEYRRLFKEELDNATLDEIRRRINGGFALGNEAFASRIEMQLGVRAAPRKAGRPVSKK